MILALLALILSDGEPAAASPAPIHNYLKGAAPRERCGERAADGEILVCAKAELDAQYRLDPKVQAGETPLLPPAQVGLGKGTLSLHGGTGARAGGVVANRAMITFTTPF